MEKRTKEEKMISKERQKFIEEELKEIGNQFRIDSLKEQIRYETWLEATLIRERENIIEIMGYIDRSVQGGFVKSDWHYDLIRFIREKTGKEL